MKKEDLIIGAQYASFGTCYFVVKYVGLDVTNQIALLPISEDAKKMFSRTSDPNFAGCFKISLDVFLRGFVPFND